MRAKLIAKATPYGYEVIAKADSDKQLRAELALLEAGEYTILTVLREKVTVAEVPSRVRVDLGAATATRQRTKKA